MNKLLLFAALLEVATGLGLIVDPALVTRLLLGARVAGPGLALGRVGGFALLALGVACWPDARSATGFFPACRAMLTYNSLTTVFFFYVGVGGDFVGPLLWPAMALHAVLAILFAGDWYNMRAVSAKRKSV